MKTSRGPTTHKSSIKIDKKLQERPKDKLSARLHFVRSHSSNNPPHTFRPAEADSESATKPQTLALNGVDLSLSLKSASVLGDWRSAFGVMTNALFSKVSYKPNEEHFKQFIGILKKVDKLDVALPMLANYDQRMKAMERNTLPESKHSDPSFNPQATKELLYKLVMRAHAEKKNWKDALRVLTEMVEKNYILPNTETMNIVLSSMDDGVQWERALTVLNQMIRTKNLQEGTLDPNEKLPDELVSLYENSPPNEVSYATIISILESAGQFKAAHKLMKDLPRKEREAIMRSYAAVIHLWSIHHHKSGKKHGRIL